MNEENLNYSMEQVESMIKLQEAFYLDLITLEEFQAKTKEVKNN
tara:strand:- start:1201 stop:1332 length:132 start_codon:yes stop_codon:yes gene_type:complete